MSPGKPHCRPDRDQKKLNPRLGGIRALPDHMAAADRQPRLPMVMAAVTAAAIGAVMATGITAAGAAMAVAAMVEADMAEADMAGGGGGGCCGWWNGRWVCVHR